MHDTHSEQACPQAETGTEGPRPEGQAGDSPAPNPEKKSARGNNLLEPCVSSIESLSKEVFRAVFDASQFDREYEASGVVRRWFWPAPGAITLPAFAGREFFPVEEIALFGQPGTQRNAAHS